MRLLKRLLKCSWVSGMVVLAFMTAGCIPTGLPDIKGRVIDAETRKPIKNAVVLFELWCDSHGTLALGSRAVFIKRIKTDEHGEYYIPSKSIKFALRGNAIIGEHLDQAFVTVYVEGYKFKKQWYEIVKTEKEKQGQEEYWKRKVEAGKKFGRNTSKFETLIVTNITSGKDVIYDADLETLKTAEEYLKNTQELKNMLRDFHWYKPWAEEVKRGESNRLMMSSEETEEDHDLIKREYKNILEKFSKTEIEKQIDTGYGRWKKVSDVVKEDQWRIKVSEQKGYTGW